MAELTVNKFPRFLSALRNVGASMEKQLDSTARQVSAKFFSELRRRQPDGSRNLDPMVLKGLINRPARPSVRMGNKPISEGWIGPTITKPAPGVRVATISTASPHLTFFTKWMGRSYLGTRGGSPIRAKNAKTLAFWWGGRARFPTTVHGHKGFAPQGDFVQDAWIAIKPEIEKANQQNIRVIVDEIRNSLR